MKAHAPMRSLLVITIVGLVAGGCSRQDDSPHSRILVDAQADALAAKILLTELREGRLTNALELLEQQVDSSIILIDGVLPKVSDQERESGVITLKSLQDYRAAHPRQREAVIPDTDTEAMTQEASRILSDLK